MNSRALQLLVGLFMLLFLGAMLVLSLRVSNLSSLASEDSYGLVAKFDSVGGLKRGAIVSASGVRVGEVSQIEYDGETFEAIVNLSIDAEFHYFPIDTSASIYTAGLLGSQYVGLEPGAEDDVLKDSDEIEYTQSALVLERLIGQMLFGRSAGNDSDEDSEDSSEDDSGSSLDGVADTILEGGSDDSSGEDSSDSSDEDSSDGS